MATIMNMRGIIYDDKNDECIAEDEIIGVWKLENKLSGLLLHNE
jgi:hypothetical protein